MDVEILPRPAKVNGTPLEPRLDKFLRFLIAATYGRPDGGQPLSKERLAYLLGISANTVQPYIFKLRNKHGETLIHTAPAGRGYFFDLRANKVDAFKCQEIIEQWESALSGRTWIGLSPAEARDIITNLRPISDSWTCNPFVGCEELQAGRSLIQTFYELRASLVLTLSAAWINAGDISSIRNARSLLEQFTYGARGELATGPGRDVFDEEEVEPEDFNPDFPTEALWSLLAVSYYRTGLADRAITLLDALQQYFEGELHADFPRELHDVRQKIKKKDPEIALGTKASPSLGLRSLTVDLGRRERGVGWTDAPEPRPYLQVPPQTQTRAPKKRIFGGVLVPDLLTPGHWREHLADARIFPDQDLAQRLAELADAAVLAVEEGDFARQESVGRQVATVSDNIPELVAQGYNLLAEGLRLQADLSTGAARLQLLVRADEAYEGARDALPRDLRSVRGQARVAEVLGDVGRAIQLYQQAYSAAAELLHELPRMDPTTRPGIEHEILRVSRHYAHFLGDLPDQDAIAARTAGATASAVRELASESAGLHRQLMPDFAMNATWSRIEWFMGLTLIARAYTSAGDDADAARELAAALSARRKLMKPDVPAAGLTKVERANLGWWVSAASKVKTEPVRGWSTSIEALTDALGRESDLQIVRCLDDLLAALRPILPPQMGV